MIFLISIPKVGLIIGKEKEINVWKIANCLLSWAIHEKPYNDAVYLHTPNENGTFFPYDFEGVIWDIKDNNVLNSCVDLNKFKIGVMINEYGATYVVV